jgi:hypothetical protein
LWAAIIREIHTLANSLFALSVIRFLSRKTVI